MLVTRASPHLDPPLESFVEGVVRPRPLVGGDASAELRVVLVRFEAGGRNLPHTHSFDQALLITDGEGFIAEDDVEHRVSAGDFILVPAGQRHWHGATDSTAMSHLAFGIPGTSDFDGVAYTGTEWAPCLPVVRSGRAGRCRWRRRPGPATRSPGPSASWSPRPCPSGAGGR